MSRSDKLPVATNLAPSREILVEKRRTRGILQLVLHWRHCLGPGTTTTHGLPTHSRVPSARGHSTQCWGTYPDTPPVVKSTNTSTCNLQERFRTSVVWEKNNVTFEDFGNKCTRQLLVEKENSFRNGEHKILLGELVDGLADCVLVIVRDIAIDGVLLAGQDGGGQTQQSSN